jgi:hypothetical protein
VIPFSQEHLRTLDCGLFHAPVYSVKEWDIDTYNIIMSLETVLEKDQYSVDIKVHMLMPGQFPCIPGWHCDNVPRVGGQQDWSKVDTKHKMYCWVSNGPFTEFEEGGKINAQGWREFTQLEPHRGTVSEEHIWRMFIRLSPAEILPIAPKEQWVRRHCQVYLDAETFKW